METDTAAEAAHGGDDSAQEDYGSKAAPKARISTPLLKAVRQSPYMAPDLLVVAGDPGSAARYAGTPLHAQAAALGSATLPDGRQNFMCDGRQDLPWGDDHEAILAGLLTSSDFLALTEERVGPDGQPVLGPPDAEGNRAALTDKVKVAVSRGQPELVFLQGSDDAWFPLMQDGRQRRRAALELQRRLDWVAALCCCSDWAVKKAVGRRNALIRVGEAARGRGGEAGRAAQSPMTHDQLLAAGLLPAGAPAYASPEVGGALHWLDAEFCRLVFGGDDLGESSKRGWLFPVKGPAPGEEVGERDPTSLSHTAAYRLRMKVSVVGTNVDPADPESMRQAIAQKEAQVPTPPSLQAENARRLLQLRKVPGDPNSAPYYNPATLAKSLGWSSNKLARYLLLLEMCDEVRALVDSGQMSMTFALDDRRSPFITWPEGKPRAALPPDKQRLVLAILTERLAPDDADEPVRYEGEAALKVAKSVRDGVLSGKLRGPSAGDQDEAAGAPRPGGPAASPTDGSGAANGAGALVPGSSGAQSGAQGQGAGAGPKKRRPAGFDPAAFRECTSRALAQVSADPAATELGMTFTDFTAPLRGYSSTANFLRARYDLLLLTRELAQVLGGAEPISALDPWPEVRDAVGAAIAQGSPDAQPRAGQPPATEAQVLLGFVSAACSAAVESSSQDVPAVTPETESGGRRPTPEQVVQANAWIAQHVTAFRADPSATLLPEYLMEQVFAAGG